MAERREEVGKAEIAARRKGREAALQMLYAMDVAQVTAEQEIDLFWRFLDGGALEGQAFANLLVRAFGQHAEAIDQRIKDVSQHWRLERMSRVDRNILRLGTVELAHVPEVPKRVTLNESIELAKRFGNEQSPGFVNGVLDRVAVELGKE